MKLVEYSISFQSGEVLNVRGERITYNLAIRSTMPYLYYVDYIRADNTGLLAGVFADKAKATQLCLALQYCMDNSGMRLDEHSKESALIDFTYEVNKLDDCISVIGHTFQQSINEGADWESIDKVMSKYKTVTDSIKDWTNSWNKIPELFDGIDDRLTLYIPNQHQPYIPSYIQTNNNKIWSASLDIQKLIITCVASKIWGDLLIESHNRAQYLVLCGMVPTSNYSYDEPSIDEALTYLSNYAGNA